MALLFDEGQGHLLLMLDLQTGENEEVLVNSTTHHFVLNMWEINVYSYQFQ